MSLGVRDGEALDLVRSRSFDRAYVATFEIELQARRLTLRFYGALRPGDRGTYLGTATFFGAGDVRLENPAGSFPDSVAIDRFALAYDDDADRGTADLHGAAGWSCAWAFDGIAYEEHPAVLASLADESSADA